MEVADLDITARVLRDRVRRAKYESKEAWDVYMADVNRALENLPARLDRFSK